MTDLIDRYMPRFDVRALHRLPVRAGPAATYAALSTADLGRSPMVGVLVALRMLPAAMSNGFAGLRDLARVRRAPTTLATLEQHGFELLETRAPDELVLGIEGQFWRPDGGSCTPAGAAFASSAPAPGMARAVWNFRVTQHGPMRSTLSTETRVWCGGDHARRRFLRYWHVIGPASGWIRRAMLRTIRDAAERHHDR